MDYFLTQIPQLISVNQFAFAPEANVESEIYNKDQHNTTKTFC